MTKNQKAAFTIIQKAPIRVGELAAQLKTTPAGLGLTLASLVREEKIIRNGDLLTVFTEAPAESPSAPVATAPSSPQMEALFRDLESAVAVHDFGETPEDKRAAYLAKVGILAIIKKLKTL